MGPVRISGGRSCRGLEEIPQRSREVRPTRVVSAKEVVVTHRGGLDPEGGGRDQREVMTQEGGLCEKTTEGGLCEKTTEP